MCRQDKKKKQTNKKNNKKQDKTKTQRKPRAPALLCTPRLDWLEKSVHKLFLFPAASVRCTFLERRSPRSEQQWGQTAYGHPQTQFMEPQRRYSKLYCVYRVHRADTVFLVRPVNRSATHLIHYTGWGLCWTPVVKSWSLGCVRSPVSGPLFSASAWSLSKASACAASVNTTDLWPHRNPSQWPLECLQTTLIAHCPHSNLRDVTRKKKKENTTNTHQTHVCTPNGTTPAVSRMSAQLGQFWLYWL